MKYFIRVLGPKGYAEATSTVAGPLGTNTRGRGELSTPRDSFDRLVRSSASLPVR